MMKLWIDKYGLYHDKPVVDGDPAGNDGPILTAYAEKLGLPVDREMIRHVYWNRLQGRPIPLERMPGKSLPPPSRDTILGWYWLGLVSAEDLLRVHWNFSPWRFPAFNIFKTLGALWRMKNAHRNALWMNGGEPHLWRFAFSVPLQDRAYIMRNSEMPVPFFYRVIEWFYKLTGPRSESSRKIFWRKYGVLILVLFPFMVSAQAKFDNNFVFGVANAPGQVEDQLSDTWLKWGEAGNVKSWKVEAHPEERLQFWTHPEVELDLAQKLGVHSFRMGVDWARVMPAKDVFDEKAIRHYHEIFKLARQRNLRIMLTLMHHSVPAWIMEQGGWHHEKTKNDFIKFSERMIAEFHDDVEWWITFNEANVFVTNSYTTGLWPPGEKSSPLSLVALGPFRGSSVKALDLMADAHNEIFDDAHARFPKISIGLAHNMAHYTSRSFLDRVSVYFADEVMNWRLPERVRGKMDFFGFNYYGAEWFKGAGLDLDPAEEYSEAGRAIDTDGLYHLLKQIHQKFPELPIMITENGVADAEDTIRGSYLIEHLLAVSRAIKEKIPVTGYYVWSLTDNLEWSDGYCPKFGLVSVDRKTFIRTPRPSYDLLRNIISAKNISPEQREAEWKKVLARQGSDRPFCRDADGITAYDQAKQKKYSRKNWRFSLPLSVDSH